MKRFTRKMISSFTLVELLIVIGIIMILAAIATPQVIGYVNRSKVARAQMEMGYLKTSLQAHFNDWGEYPNTLAELRGSVVGSINISTNNTITGLQGPIDYLAKDPPLDMFYKLIIDEDDFGKTYRYATNTDQNDFVLWSYGPNKAGGSAGVWTPEDPGPPLVPGSFDLTGKDSDDILVRP